MSPYLAWGREPNRRDIFKQNRSAAPGRVASAGGLNASHQHPSQARSGLSDNAIATRLGDAFALGEEQIGVDGLGTTGLPITVHRSPVCVRTCHS